METVRMPSLLEINPELDRAGLAARFSDQTRIQVRDALRPECARKIAELLVHSTPWGMNWQAGQDGPNPIRREQCSAFSPQDLQSIWQKAATAASTFDDFAFVYSQYQMSEAYVGGWSGSELHDQFVREMNSPLFLSFIREVTGLPEIAWADAQATLYGPQQYLTMHQDLTGSDGRLVAYVLNLCTLDWRPDWGGYLNFFDGQGDIVAGFRPRFNSLNMFTVPQNHNVSFVPAFAPFGRFAITGWFRDGRAIPDVIARLQHQAAD